MKKVSKILWLGLAAVLLWNCGNQTNKKVGSADKSVVQQEGGVISLKLANAECYTDQTDPSVNTAEWNVVISKPGKYKVWLSSATKDTINLNYKNTVKVSLSDNQLEVIPACDKVIHNSKEVSFPYFRADSYMGLFNIEEPGEYNIQVISEKVMPKLSVNQPESIPDKSKLMAVILSPM